MNLNDSAAPKNEPVVNQSDMTRFKTLPLAKRHELQAAAGEGESPVPPANDTSGDVVDWARADTEAELEVRRRTLETRLRMALGCVTDIACRTMRRSRAFRISLVTT